MPHQCARSNWAARISVHETGLVEILISAPVEMLGEECFGLCTFLLSVKSEDLTRQSK
jgi:hypothetical protein